MKDFFRIKTLIITLCLIIVAILISAVLAFFDFKKMDLSYKIANAAFDSNVSGFAWSENIGWISFNSKDCDIDDDGVFEGAGETGGPAPTGCPTSGTANNYGVNINSSTGNFSGYAWSSNVGWIDFAPASGYPSNPQSAAHYNSATGQITGWAKILSLGDDGWLKMAGDGASWNGSACEGTNDYGNTNQCNWGVKIDSGTGDFSGWAWNGGGIGWVSFNSNNCDTNDNGFLDVVCGGDDITITYIDYKVHAEGIGNASPTISFDPMTDPGNLSYNEACSLGALNAQLKWKFNDSVGDTELKYKIIFDSANHTLSELDSMVDGAGVSLPLVTGELNGNAENFWPTQTNAYGRIVSLSYNTPYYWWVKVWDSGGASSSWTAGPSFTTYAHEFPNVYFSWSPAKPNQDENVNFSDIDLDENRTSYYTAGNPSSATECDVSKCNFNWVIQDASEVDVSDKQNPIYKFTSTGSKSAKLTVTDNDGYSCESAPQTIQVNTALPTWKETKKQNNN